MEFQALPQSSLSLTDYFKLSIIILNFQLLQFHLLVSFNVLSSYMSFCLCQQPFEKQKTAFFWKGGWYFYTKNYLHLYNINHVRFTICKSIPAFNMCIIDSHYYNIYHTNIYLSIFFWEIFNQLHKQIHHIQYYCSRCNQ